MQSLQKVAETAVPKMPLKNQPLLLINPLHPLLNAKFAVMRVTKNTTGCTKMMLTQNSPYCR
jgi:hypothetical protein